jgi:signal transduction histidine kinase
MNSVIQASYDIVKAHGGEIKVNTKEKEGTEFTIILPA